MQDPGRNAVDDLVLLADVAVVVEGAARLALRRAAAFDEHEAAWRERCELAAEGAGVRVALVEQGDEALQRCGRVGGDGGGETFDWSLIPSKLPLPLILSGGLNAGNVAEAVRCVQPWAVDVSSGVEAAKGIKDAVRIIEFVAGVQHAHG